MESLKELYRIGNGPSSSHTMGPKKAADIFFARNKDARSFKVNLYGSLASTGKGHLTDKVILDTLGKNTTVSFLPNVTKPFHHNALEFFSYDLEGKLIDNWLVYSIGGGEIVDEANKYSDDQEVYKLNCMADILKYCEDKNISLYDYVLENEKDITSYLDQVFTQMISCVEGGLVKEGTLPGPLHVNRRAKVAYNKYIETKDIDKLIFASALAASEENANGEVVVTAPTCGSCGVIPGILYAYFRRGLYTKKELIEGLAVAGLIGNLVKHNASISGAEVGCQGEVGVACAMASSMDAYLHKATNKQIEYAAEIALEHHLGMTCDPVLGYVQIPCIERNALSSKTAINCSEYARMTDGQHYVSLDSVIQSMAQTGKDLKEAYKETSLGGLAKTTLNK